jgi:hypothetical protein
LWAQSAPLSLDLIQRYTQRYDRVGSPKTPKGTPSFLDVVGRSGPTPREEVEAMPRRFWRDSITSFALPATESIIRDLTDWDKKGWNWYCSRSGKVRERDRLLVFDFVDQCAYIADVKDVIECPTPDGNHFVAFRAVRAFRRRKMTPKLWADLKKSGIVASKKGARARRLIGSAKQNAMATAFKRR